MEWLYCIDGCGDMFAGIEGVGIVDFEIEPGSTVYYAAYYRMHRVAKR